MVYEITILPVAQRNLDKTLDWYDKISIELSDDFLSRFEQALLQIKAQPLHYQKVYKNFRKFNLTRFPYKVVFKVDKNTIFITAVAHHKRHPKVWRKRY